MNDVIKISEKYEPLFNFPKGVDTFIITGGRFSQKSFAVGLASCTHSMEGHRILYTRYTLASASDSIIPEFTEKIEMMGFHKMFYLVKDRIKVIGQKGRIVFRGIMSSRGNMTANLKSLKDFSMFILDEAEEMPNYEDWRKIKLSIRAHDMQNVSILILNPAKKDHWIHEEFFTNMGVPDGFNGIIDNVCYIHTTYQDCPQEFIPDNFLKEFEDERLAYEYVESIPKKQRESINKVTIKKWKHYKTAILGGWLDNSENTILTDWEFGAFDESLPFGFGLDFGSKDPDALVRVAANRKEMKLYWKEELYKNNLGTDELGRIVKKITGSKLVIADSAGKRTIQDLQKFNVNIQPVSKSQIVDDIKQLDNWTIIVDPESKNLAHELNDWIWLDRKGEIPRDKDNHLIDAGRYYSKTIILNPSGGSKWQTT